MNRLCTKRVFPITVLCALVASLLLCSADITLPANFHYELLFDNLPHVRSMTISPSGIVYVGSFLPQNDPVFIGLPSDVYALDVTNRKVYTVASGLVVPNGVAFRNGNLYIGLVDQILVVRDVEANLQTPPAPEVFVHLVNSSLVLPNPLHHGWRYMKFGPDGKLYVAMGSPCNTPSDPGNGTCSCELRFDPVACAQNAACMQCQANLAPGPHQNVGQIVRIDMETKQIETVAYGVRNSVGFDFDPVDHKLWWTDNGRDDWDPGHDDRPPDELNRVDEIGKHYGFPFCYGPGLVDYEFNAAGSCANYVNVTQPLQPHAAALGMRFARSSVFPAVYQRGVFVAEHGSWDRDVPVGYRVTFVSLDAAGNPLSYEPFLQGLMSWNGTMKSVMGRPVDVEFLQDGSMLMTDDSKGRVYRIWYDGQSSGDSSGDSDDTVFPEWSKWLIISVTGATVLVVGTCMVCRARRKNKGYRSV